MQSGRIRMELNRPQPTAEHFEIALSHGVEELSVWAAILLTSQSLSYFPERGSSTEHSPVLHRPVKRSR